MKNLGGFEKLFPLPKVQPPKQPEDPDESDEAEFVRQQKRYNAQASKVDLYEEVRSLAESLFENQFGVKKAPKRIDDNFQSNQLQDQK